MHSLIGDTARLRALAVSLQAHLEQPSVQRAGWNLLDRVLEAYEGLIDAAIGAAQSPSTLADPSVWVQLVVDQALGVTEALSEEIAGLMLRCVVRCAAIARMHLVLALAEMRTDAKSTPKPPTTAITATASAVAAATTSYSSSAVAQVPVATPNAAAHPCLPWLTLLCRLTDPSPAFWSIVNEWHTRGGVPASLRVATACRPAGRSARRGRRAQAATGRAVASKWYAPPAMRTWPCPA